MAGSAYFDSLCRDALRYGRTQGEDGIGTMQEKRLHAVIKHYLCSDPNCHEVGLEGSRYIADVRMGDAIFEVQTGSFAPMREKIAYCLSHTDAVVTVVHPISVIKWVSWVDAETATVSPRRKAPKERIEDLLCELYPLRELLGNPRLRFRLLLLETQDFRVLSKQKNRKRGAERYERMPLSLIDEIEFSSREDFRRFIPNELPTHFTVKQFSVLSGIRGVDAYSAVRVLTSLGLFDTGEKIGRSMGFVRRDL
ncbi:MAG: hypothetical protein IKB75_04810 [Clostridia bacterium]|nr:hypothetical protein [Clostridia bacterium]